MTAGPIAPKIKRAVTYAVARARIKDFPFLNYEPPSKKTLKSNLEANPRYRNL